MAQILVIDDDPLIRRSLTRLFVDEGHCVHEASTLSIGLEQAKGDVDVVYLDLDLPDGNGLKAIDELAGLGSRPEVIVITGMGAWYGAEKSMESNAWDYIPKPASPKQVLEALEGALAYRREKKLARQGSRTFDRCGMVGESHAMQRCFGELQQAAASDAAVLICGETGVGKELAARSIHQNSGRREKPFIVVDCSNLAESLIESTLYGHVRGAFTGAHSEREGLIAQADGGTLFLDEIGELPLELQKSLLRVLQEKRFRPIGSGKEQASDFRLVAATNRDLARMVEDGMFRSDLLFRLRTVSLVLPPLREREKDSESLALTFVERCCDRYGLAPKTVSGELLRVVSSYSWPGNVRELMNVMEAAVIHAGTVSVLYPKHLPSHVRLAFLRDSEMATSVGMKGSPLATKRLEDGEILSYGTYKSDCDRHYFESLMEYTKFDIPEASRLAGLSVASVYRYLAQNGISTRNKSK